MRMIVAAAIMSSIASTALLSQESILTPLARADSLRNAGSFAAAADSLRALLQREPENGDAARMLAQTLYWQKDFGGARKEYVAAMAQHPEDYTLKLDYARMLVEIRDARRAREILEPMLSDSLTVDRARELLHENRLLSVPSVSAGGGGLHDDQPVDRGDGYLGGDIFVAPLTQVTGLATVHRLQSTDSLVSLAYTGELGIRQTVASNHLQLEAAGGAFFQSARSSYSTYLWRGSVSAPLANGFAFYVEGGRAPYLATISSWRAHVVTTSGSILLNRSSASGWLGEASLRYQHFPDSNAVAGAYAWALAPLIHAAPAVLRAGYALSWQDSKESRFVSNVASSSGHFIPYYTPQNLIEHTAIASIAVKPSAVTEISANAGYGFHATESGFVFHPWNAAAHFRTTVNSTSSVTLSIEHMKTAFYSATSGSIGFTWKILPNPQS